MERNTVSRRARRRARTVVYALVLVLALGVLLDGIVTRRGAQASTNCATQTSGLSASVSVSGRYCLLTVTWGTGTWSIPSNVTSFDILVVGGGGGGGADAGGGGGGGGLYVGTVSLAQTLTVMRR